MRRLLIFVGLLNAVIAWGAEIDAESIARRCTPAVMLIVADRSGGGTSLGTAFAISADGKLVTNYHVIEGKERLIAKSHNGGIFPIGTILATDPAHDLAILKIDAKDLPFLELGESAAVNPGSGVVVIGNPVGLEATVTQGIVSARRQLESHGEVLQITAAISPGSSGSPVFNAQGKVVGVATLKFLKGESLNFAIPSSAILPLLANSNGSSSQKLPLSSSVFPSRRKDSKEQDKAVLLDPRFKQVKSCEDRQDFAPLLRISKELAADFPESALAERILSDAYFYMGMKRDCLDHIYISIDRDPQSPRAWNNLAIAFKDSGNAKGALEAYQHALKLDPDDAKVLAEYAVETAQSLPSAAESAARHALQLLKEGKGTDVESSTYPIFPTICDAFKLLGRAEDSYSAAIEGVRRQPSGRENWEALADSAIECKLYGAVSNIVAQGLKQSKGDDSQLYYFLGLAKAEQQDYASALKAFRWANSINQNDKEILTGLARMVLVVWPQNFPASALNEVNQCIDQLRRIDATEGEELFQEVQKNLDDRRR